MNIQSYRLRFISSLHVGFKKQGVCHVPPLPHSLYDPLKYAALQLQMFYLSHSWAIIVYFYIIIFFFSRKCISIKKIFMFK